MRRTCFTCHHHKDERGHITCGFNGKCIFGDCYEPMRGSLEELQMAVDPWKKAMALHDAKMLNWKDTSNEYKAELDALNKKIYEITAIDIGDGDDKSVISVFDKQHNTISSRVITTDNPDAQSWLKSFMQIDKDGKEFSDR